MTRTEIIAAFRAENPDIPSNVVTDPTLNSWLIEGNKDFCMQTYCITGSGSFSATVGTDTYDLTDSDSDAYIENFLDIDEFPGGGVTFNGKRIRFVTKSDLDHKTRSWRSNSNGTPEKYFMRGESITFERPPSVASTITVDAILYPDDFDNDNIEPFNQRPSLSGYSYGLVYYITFRAKRAKKKKATADAAELEYQNYVTRARKRIRKGTHGPIQFRP